MEGEQHPREGLGEGQGKDEDSEEDSEFTRIQAPSDPAGLQVVPASIWTLTAFNAFVPPPPSADTQIMMEALLFCHRQIRELGLGQTQQQTLLQQWFGKFVGMAGWVQSVAAQQECLVQSVCRLQGSVNDQFLEILKDAEAKANEAFELASRMAEATLRHQRSFGTAKGWPGLEKLGETWHQVATMRTQIAQLEKTVASLNSQIQVAAQAASLHPVSASEMTREVQKVATRSQQYVETRLQEVERHFWTELASHRPQDAALPPEVAQRLTQMEEQMGKEREEFAKALGATRLRAHETERSFTARISQLEDQMGKAASLEISQAPPPQELGAPGGLGSSLH